MALGVFRKLSNFKFGKSKSDQILGNPLKIIRKIILDIKIILEMYRVLKPRESF